MAILDKKKIVLAVGGPRRIQIGPIHHLPLSLLSLGAWLREKGNCLGEIRILDTQIQHASASDFEEAAILGISAMTGLQVKYGLKVAELARKSNPDILIVWGGIHPSLLPDQTLNHPLVDIVVIGEGEQTFLEIVEAVFSGNEIAQIQGICFRSPNGEIITTPRRPLLRMDEFPLPAYDLVDVTRYSRIDYQFDYQSSRGCPFQCTFCYNVAFCGSRYRKKSADKVVDELIDLHDRYGVINFGLVDDEFFLDLKRAEAVFEGILNSGRKFGITASCRLDIARRFSPSLLRMMKGAGVRQIFFGAESGADRILRKIQKKITTRDILEGAETVSAAGIRPILSFMSGFPGETLEDFMDTLRIILQLWDRHPLITVNGIFPFNAYPGTKLYEEAVTSGLKPPETLEEWGNWTFQYEPDNPWLDPVLKQSMETVFYMVRFRYYIARYEDRYKGRLRILLLKAAAFPLSASIKIRMKKRWFKMAWEWKIFAFIARRTFGYL